MIYGKLGLKFTKQLKKFKEYAFKKPMTKKYTGDPMIKTDAYSINSVLKNYPKKQIKSSLKFKKRRELLKKKNEFGVSMARTWNKSSPAGKAKYVAIAAAPKALFVGAGYLAGNTKKET
jgi:hypothetical protein|tara:strand:+ start:105 stop:461 length:357 start_codon:yes stop_codon:yes gene_type:complete